MTRESINRIKVEDFRISKVPIDPTVTIYQGDLLCWDDTNHRAAPLTSASGGNFLGIAEGQNPQPSMSATLADPTVSRINVIQEGLVELIFDESATVYPGDRVMLGTTDVQHVKKTSATANNQVGVVADENNYGAAGKALVLGDPVLIWLRVPSTYKRK